ncbi:Protein of unknown function [Pyronema omphalodes CBS 100304]|uniref:Uncharacterized protein n=1 Tax=Pyronema omphalodes (strain CBS 100304) TaxID=1076935 RepID=U4L550_PYROM|nr:Protein of unknown function [Pyronema omphalodes CBS 100304]
MPPVNAYASMIGQRRQYEPLTTIQSRRMIFTPRKQPQYQCLEDPMLSDKKGARK